MAFSFDVRILTVALLATSLTAACQAQGPDAMAPGRPGVSIGGPFGVIIGGGRGLRIGGPNGAQFGGGVGARFGGDYGAQFGGGQGVRIGPREYGPPPGADFAPEHSTARFIDLSFETAGPGETLLHFPQEAEGPLRIRIGGEEAEIYPGDTLAVPNTGRTSIQIARPIGGFGWRRTLKPGIYVFEESARGWTIVPGQMPVEQDYEQPALPTADPELNAPEFEQLPAPPLPDQPEAQDASDQDQPRRLLLRRRR